VLGISTEAFNMKITKTVTEKVIAANRANSQKSTGPHNVEVVKENAVKHGLLARRIVFKNEEEQFEFNRLFEALCDEYQPSGPTEFMLVEEAATCIWKWRIANMWESQELANRENAAAYTRALAENHYEQQLPLFTRGDGSNSAAQLGWVCEELVIQSGSRNSELNYGSYSKDRDKKDKAGHVIIQAKLGSGLGAVLRYQAALKRDLYRAIAALRKARVGRKRNRKFTTSRKPPQPTE
jgi:hypothetical protein